MTTQPRPPARALGNLVATRLASVRHASGYYGQIGRPLPGREDDTPPDPPVKDQASGDLRVRPYFVYYPGTPDNGFDEPVAGPAANGAGSAGFQVTAAGGDVEDVLALVDRINTALQGWRPRGRLDGLIRPQPGYQPRMQVDRTHTPERLFVPLLFVHSTTTR